MLGAIVPDLDHVVGGQKENLPTPAKPILPLHIRPALLAAIAIVERAGPEMLRMLRSHMMGGNRTGFSHSAKNMIRAHRWDEVGFIILMIVVAVALIDLASHYLRSRLMNAGIETPPSQTVKLWAWIGRKLLPAR